KKWISKKQLDTFFGDNTLLAVHPEAALQGVDFSRGSLGQGISFAVAAALAAHIRRVQRRAYCLISDAECNEGSVWEAAMFAAHHRLGNLRVIVDVKGQQAFGLTAEVLDISNLGERWAAFGWRVSEVDGHSVDQIAEVLSSDAGDEKPH